MVLRLNKFKPPSPKDALNQIWLKFNCPVVLEKKIFNFVNVFLPFGNNLHLEKGRAIHLKNLNPLHPKMHCAKFG